MGHLLEEVKLWNTPAIGAYLLWRFTKGYCESHPNGDAPVGLLHFVAAAILTSKRLLEPISNRREDLQSYVRSFEKEKKSDLLISVQDRIKERLAFTLEAIDIAITEGLMVWDPNSGKLYPRDITGSEKGSKMSGKGLANSIIKDGKKAEILGKWFSKNDLQTIASYLKVVF